MNIQQKVSAEGEVMAEKLSINTAGIMAERFGKDTLISNRRCVPWTGIMRTELFMC